MGMDTNIVYSMQSSENMRTHTEYLLNYVRTAEKQNKNSSFLLFHAVRQQMIISNVQQFYILHEATAFSRETNYHYLSISAQN